MSRIRYAKANQKKPSRAPNTPMAWLRLMQKVIARARQLRDRRVPGLERALKEQTMDKMLRRMGIICEADILREFPDPKT